ncbi:winged helix-turn-helix domain-containing protein [Micromonospora sp. NPDC049559]|uniref:winged helix-turn-helix domain-containing protein n=1 Tax=Micromonospora sp. NPDC049559 TaxID=3155923 RepID=UPI00343DD9E1
MSVVAISPRTYPPGGTVRSALARRRPAPGGSPSVLTVTIDLTLGGEALTPQASRVLELLEELVQRGDGTVTVAGSGAPPPVVEPARPVALDPVQPGELRVLAGSRVVLRDGETIPLTRLEFDLLHFLAQHPRRVFTRLQLLNSVWGYHHAVARTVDVHVRRLRAKVGESTPLVTTVYGVGYRLADEARVSVDPQR